MPRRPFAAAFVAALCAAGPLFAAPPAPAPSPSITSVIPADSLGGLIIPNLQALSDKVSKFVTQLGITRRYGIPLPPNLLAYGARLAGIDKAIDAHGSIAIFVLPAPDLDADHISEHAIILFPTIDAAALIAPFSPQDPNAEGIRQVTIPGNPDPVFTVPFHDHWVAAAESIDTLHLLLHHSAEPLDHLPLAAAITRNDLSYWIDVPAALALNGQTRDTLMTQLVDGEADATDPDPLTAAAQKTFLDFYNPEIITLVTDTRDVVVSGNLSDDGISFSASASFTPNSASAKGFASLFQPAADFNGLPDGDFIFASSFAVNGNALASQISALEAAFLANPQIANDARSAAVKPVFEAFAASAAGFHGIKTAAYIAPENSTTGLGSIAILADVDNPQKPLDLLNTTITNLGPIPSFTTDDGLQVSFEFKPDALTVDGSSFSRFHITFSGKDASDDVKKTLDILSATLGTDGINIYCGAVGNRILLLAGADADSLKSAVAAAKSNSPALANRPELAAARRQLLPHPVLASHIAIARYATLATRVMAIVPNPWSDQITPMLAPAASAPPISASVAYDHDALSYQVFYPSQLFVAIMDIIDNFRHTIAPPAPNQGA